MSSTTILIADDSRTIRTQVRRILVDEGFGTVEASSGVEALERIRECCPSAAVLDINMPELDGYGVCIELSRMGDPWNRLPIVFLTSMRSQALQTLGDELGAYLCKPVEPQSLLDALASVLPPHMKGTPQSI
ncbi:Response regulator MprA [Maioricimonas rarisocia]|uniref:Response regulator MprA n=1 Tax=Maioricimonas rarisocia TaxID=2528026 RepID=A0A517ZDD6_9PLAN|nr:response regulator [Maioricimonas rarisocia]QDU40450.1 Response regulator MprA [Maioricimonas rarisocia]